MGQVIITTYSPTGVVSISVKPTKCHSDRKQPTATKGEKMMRKFGYSPFKKWGKFKERNGGL